LGWVGIASGLGNPFFYSNAAYNVLTGASRTYFLGSSGYIFNSAINVGNGWWRITIEYYGSLPGGDFCFVGVTTNANGDIVNSSTANGVDGMYVWGVQFELGTFPTSYIPTSSSTVTRAADVASMTGTNFSSWYNQSQGTIFASVRTVTPASVANGFLQLTDGTVNNRIELAQVNSGDAFPRVEGLYRYLNSTTANFQNQETGWIPNGATVDNWAFGFNSTGYTFQTKFDTTPSTGSGTFPQNLTNFSIGHKGTIARLTYYPVRLSNITLQALTTYGPVSSFPYSFSIKGRDILALKEVNKTSTRDFVFIKGLSSKAQPRITTASQYTASGVALRNAAMLKVAPTTVGNYFFSSGLTVSGTTVQINGTNALSIATSPFSSATATVPLLFAGLRPQANWRFSEAMTSGTVVSPEFAIPIETSDFLLFIKTGQS
jgi:hypothetical protein